MQRNDAYEAALTELRDDTQGWWAETLKLEADELEEDEEVATADVAGLRGFIEEKVLPWFEERREEIGRRPLLRDQALANHSTQRSSNASAVTRSTSTASWSACCRCCFGSRSCAGFKTPHNPFRNTFESTELLVAVHFVGLAYAAVAARAFTSDKPTNPVRTRGFQVRLVQSDRDRAKTVFCNDRRRFVLDG